MSAIPSNKGAVVLIVAVVGTVIFGSCWIRSASAQTAPTIEELRAKLALLEVEIQVINGTVRRDAAAVVSPESVNKISETYDKLREEQVEAEITKFTAELKNDLRLDEAQSKALAQIFRDLPSEIRKDNASRRKIAENLSKPKKGPCDGWLLRPVACDDLIYGGGIGGAVYPIGSSAVGMLFNQPVAVIGDSSVRYNPVGAPSLGMTMTTPVTIHGNSMVTVQNNSGRATTPYTVQGRGR